VSLSVFVADGLRVGVDLRDQPGCIIMHMVETARFLANAFRLHPDNVRMVRPVVVD